MGSCEFSSSSGTRTSNSPTSHCKILHNLSSVSKGIDLAIFDEYFLDQPLEQLTGDKLQRLLERAELVTA
ncbi:hypothetical protein A4S05_11195 [Nostoc sp. KVJ20]|nr:hypothetical protein A4S05_11195 [Nostoc sp. KVJ20]